MSDITRSEVLEILEHNWTSLHNPDYTDEELAKALEYCINSLETDEAYQLEYERISEQANKQISEHHRKNIHANAHDFGVSEEQAEKELRVEMRNGVEKGKVTIIDLKNSVDDYLQNTYFKSDEFKEMVHKYIEQELDKDNNDAKIDN